MAKSGSKHGTRILSVGLALLMLVLGGRLAARNGGTTAVAQQPEPTPTADPLAIPTLPPNPTQVDHGRVSYYYNCMPCHGDHGQGLTDEWRATWVDDHQNCWERGCHGGRAGDEGFPLPRTIPAVAGPDATLDHFASATILHDYLQQTHPPQHPGVLPDDEYWALTAYLLAENGRALPDEAIGPETGAAAANHAGLSWLLALAITAVIGVFIFWLWHRQGKRPS